MRMHARGWLLVALVAGCGSAPPARPAEPTRVATTSPEAAARAERARRDKLVAAHRILEEEQQTAFAATCATPTVPQPRCEPGCYHGADADPRAGKRITRAEIVHLACRPAADEAGAVILVDEVPSAAIKPQHGRVPKAHEAGSPEDDVETAVRAALGPEVARGDAVRVTGTWKAVAHPVSKEALRCIAVSHFVASLKKPLDGCGSRGHVTCEAAGNPAAHGLDVIHFRLAEGRELHATHRDPACQRAALEAIAVARGMPRWRQYATLNVAGWKAWPRYRTRFDGLLDEDAVFAQATALGAAAQALYVTCGGAPDPKTTVAQEQSFHACW